MGKIIIEIDENFADLGFPYQSKYNITYKATEDIHCGVTGQCDIEAIEKDFALVLDFLKSQKQNHMNKIVEEERKKIQSSVSFLKSKGYEVVYQDTDSIMVQPQKKV